ncbi:MAG: HAD-IA family hydrolase, partial [Candidatus Omnitrophica bacterium]|nr:HAD-IA family hydrolase [Candidatus Omnitrophota bacterium]
IDPSLIASKHAVLIPPVREDGSKDDAQQVESLRYIEDLQEGIQRLLLQEISHSERMHISSTVKEYSWKTIYNRVSDVYNDVIRKRVERYSPKSPKEKPSQFSKQVKVVEVHPTNKCNLSCYKCPYGRLHHDGETFPFEDISKIAEMKPEKIFVLGGGEPSLYSWKGHDIYDFMRVLREQNEKATISLCTNGIIYLDERLQNDIDILRVSTHGFKGEHFQAYGEDMPESVKKINENIWRYFQTGVLQDQWTTFLFDKHNVMDAIIIVEALWNKWNQLCEKNSALRLKKFGFKLIYLADDKNLECPFHLSNPDDQTMKLWAEAINAIKQSNSPFAEYLKNYDSESANTGGFILPQEIADAMLPVREAPKVSQCLLSKDHALIGADGNIYPCRIQAANAGYTYGKVAHTTVDELALERKRLFDKPLHTCSSGCRLMHTLIGQAITKYDDDNVNGSFIAKKGGPTNKKLLIFDMDGTLYNSLDFIIHQRKVSTKWIAAKLGKTNKEIMEMWPWQERKTESEFVKECGLDLREYYEGKAEFLDVSKLSTPEVNEYNSKLRNLLDRLSKKYHLALVTNNGEKVAHKILEALGLDDLFEYIIGEDTFFSGKPETAMFEKAMNYFVVTPAEVVSIGDNLKHDVDTIEELGGDGIFVPNGPVDIINELETKLEDMETNNPEKSQTVEGSPELKESVQSPLTKVRGLLHNASTYGNMSTGKWLGFPERAELVAQGRFDDVMPVNAQFVPSQLCPSNCLTCTYGRNKDEMSVCSDKSPFVMSLEDIKLYIDRLAAAGVQSITFTGGGDPLFNKALFDGIEYASHEKGLATGLFTEAHLVTDKIAERMVNVGLKFIRISFNAGRPITYKYFFGVGEKMFYKALENIEKVAAAKEKFGKRLGLGVGVIITPLNVMELMEIARLIQGIADRHPGTLAHLWYRPTVRYLRGVQLANPKTNACLEYIKRHPDLKKYYDAYHKFTYDGEQFPASIFQKAMDDLANRIKPFIENKPNGVKVFYPKTRIEAMDEIAKGFSRCRACPWLTFVGSDGSVYHCVEHGLDPKAIYGNLKTQTLEEIWQSQQRQEVIKFMAEEGLDNRCPPMCMLTEQNRIFEVISEVAENAQGRAELRKAIKEESDVFMDKIGKKIGDGIKFMNLGVLFVLGILFIDTGLSLVFGKLLITAELFVIAGVLVNNAINLRADKKNKRVKPLDAQTKPEIESSPKKEQINFTILSLFHNRYVFYAESLGPSVIKSYLKEQFGDAVKVDIIDLQFERDVDSVLEELSMNPPEIIGLSAKVLTQEQMMDILEKRKNYPSFEEKGTLFVVGNITGASMYQEIIAEHEDVMVVVGEGEEASRDLILFLRGEKSIEEISNTAYWDLNKGRSVLNPTYNTVEFSKLPAPDRKNAEQTLKHGGVVYAEWSRGCSWGNCTFCSMWKSQKRQWRHKPIDVLLKELDELQNMGADRFEFTDSDFMGPNIKEVSDLDIYREFAEKKIKSKNTLSFFAYLRVHSIYHKDDTVELRQAKIDTLKLLKKSGLRVVSVGADYGSDKQAKRFNKGTTKEEVKEAVKILEEVGIETIKLGMILFDPFMSFDELLEGMEFVKNAQIEKYIHFPFARVTFYETSPLTKLAKKNGILNQERTLSLSFRATEFIDQRVGRLSRVFDAWHKENKPIIFGIQEMRREGEQNDDVQKKTHHILEKLRKQYYYFLDDMVSSYKNKNIKDLESVIYKHLDLRASYLKELIELIRNNREGKASNKVYRLAVESYYSDLLMVRVLEDSMTGNYVDWEIYRNVLDIETDLTTEDKENILKKTFVRVQEQIKFRNPKLHVPNPDIEKVKTQIEKSFDKVVSKVSSIIGVSSQDVAASMSHFKKEEQGMKLLWALERCLGKVHELKKSELISKMGLEVAIKYLLILSWELECGNDDLIFIDEYSSKNNANIDDLQRATNYCFKELDVNNRNSITAKKVFLSVQRNAFDINEIPRILADDKAESYKDIFDKNEQLSKRNIVVSEIDQLIVNNRVFNPVLHYQMTGLLANIIPKMTYEKVLEIGTGIGVLGIVAALRGADSVVELDVNSQACQVAVSNSKKYGVSDKVDVRQVTEQMQGNFFEAIDSSEKFDLIITNPPWGAGAMIGYLGRALSDPKQEFLQYFLKKAPNFLNENGEIIIGYSSRNDYDERTLIDIIDSLKGVVDYKWEVIGSLEFSRPLYSEMFYAVRLRLERDKVSEISVNNNRGKAEKVYDDAENAIEKRTTEKPKENDKGPKLLSINPFAVGLLAWGAWQIFGWTLLAVLPITTGYLIYKHIKNKSNSLQKESSEVLVGADKKNELLDLHNVSLETVDDQGIPQKKQDQAKEVEDKQERSTQATELFEIVEGYLNNRRAKVVKAYTEAKSILENDTTFEEVAELEDIKVEDTTEKISKNLDLAIDWIDAIKAKGKASDELLDCLNIITEHMDKLYADTIIASIIVKARAAKKQGQSLIIGLETGWIPGNEKGKLQYSAITGLLKEINDLEDTLRSMGLDNVKVISADKDSISTEIL